MAFAINYIGANDIGGDGSGNVSSSIGIGTASADRIVVVVLTYRSNAFCTTPTLGGSNMTLVKRDTETTSAPDARADMYKIRITTGTTATLATTGLTPASNSFVAHVYTITGASWTETDSDSITGTSVSVVMTGLTIPATGKGIVGFCNVTSGAVANTGYNEDSDANSTVGTNNHRYSTGNVTTTGTNNLTFDGATASQVAIGAAWDVAVGPVVTIGTGQEVATLHAFEAILAADGGITEPWIGSVNNELITDTVDTTFTNYGQTSTNTITLQPQSGDGFADVHDYSSDPLDWDGSDGARILLDTNVNLAWSSQNHWVIQGLQWSLSTADIDFSGCGNNFKFQRNIVRNITAYCSINATSSDALLANNLFIFWGGTGAFSFLCGTSGSHDTYLIHNTFINVNSANTNATAQDSFNGFSGTVYAHWFGNAAYTVNTTTGISYDAVAGNEALELDYNLSNEPSDTWVTGNSSTAGDLSADWTDTTAAAATDAVDLRPKAGGLPIAFIPSASRYTNQGSNSNYDNCADTDIRNQTRSGVDNDCGCFQKTVAATGLPEGLRAANFTLNF